MEALTKYPSVDNIFNRDSIEMNAFQMVEVPGRFRVHRMMRQVI